VNNKSTNKSIEKSRLGFNGQKTSKFLFPVSEVA
jgi:hypothetical protein